MRAFRQVTEQPEKAETLTRDWASQTMSSYLDYMTTYLECCAKSTDGVERMKYYESAVDALGHICVAAQLLGALADPEELARRIFGEVPVELIDLSE